MVISHGHSLWSFVMVILMVISRGHSSFIYSALQSSIHYLLVIVICNLGAPVRLIRFVIDLSTRRTGSPSRFSLILLAAGCLTLFKNLYPNTFLYILLSFSYAARCCGVSATIVGAVGAKASPLSYII